MKYIFILLIFVAVALFGYQNLNLGIAKESSAQVNHILNQQIHWSNQWQQKKIGNANVMYANYPGSSFSFQFSNSKAVGIHVKSKDTNNPLEVKILLDGKEYLLNNPNINDKKLFILIPENKHNEIHTLDARLYCDRGLYNCDITIDEIILDGGKIITTDIFDKRKVLGVLGDSVSLHELSNNYTAIVASELGFTLQNASYWGSTLGKENGKAPAIERYKKELLPYNPDIIIVFLGINDVLFASSSESFTNDYNALVSGLKQEMPQAKIVTISILPGKEEDQYSERIREFNKIISKVSENNNVFFADATEWLNKADYNDQIHPNIQGERAIANHIITYFSQNNIK